LGPTGTLFLTPEKKEWPPWLLLSRTCETLWNWAVNGPFIHPQDGTRVNMEHRWNDTDREKPNNSEKNLSQCHFVYHKSHIDSPGREPGPPRWEASH
jgi:hypothetical protein